MVIRQCRRAKVQREEPPSPSLVALSSTLMQQTPMDGGRSHGVTILRRRRPSITIPPSARHRPQRLRRPAIVKRLAVGMVRGRSKTRLGWHGGRIRQQHQGHSLGQLLRKRIVKDKGVVSPLILWYIVGPLRNLVCLALPNPFNLFQPDGRQFLDHGEIIVAAVVSSASHGARRQVLSRIGALRVGGR